MTHPLTLLDRTLVMLVLGICAFLFLTVGWMVMEPDDPLGAVSLWSRSGALVMWIEAAGLACVAAALATMLIGRHLPDVGILAAALGLALVTLRGSPAGALLIRGANPPTDPWGMLLAMETAAWFVVVVLAAGVSALVYRWRWMAQGFDNSSMDEASNDIWGAMAVSVQGSGFPPRHGRVAGATRRAGTVQGSGVAANPLHGFLQMVIVFAVGMVLLRLLSVDAESGAVQHGQSYFAVWVAFYFGFLVGFRFFPTGTAFWGLVAVPLVAIVGYLLAWTVAGSSSAGGVASPIPRSVFLRSLPLTYISVGTSAVLCAFWSARRRREGSAPTASED